MDDGMKSLKMMAADGWKGAIWAVAEVARLKAEIKRLKIKPSEHKHNEDCELRGGGPCYCKQE